jgi:hypothetical protein
MWISAGNWITEHWSRTAILNPPWVGPPHELSFRSQNLFFCRAEMLNKVVQHAKASNERR